MKLWMFNHYAVAPGASGGTRHYDLGRMLAAEGCEVSIFASSFQHFSKEDPIIMAPGAVVGEERFGEVRFVWLKTNRYEGNDWGRIKNMFVYSYRALRDALKREERPDVVIGSLMHPLAALVGYWVARKKKAAFYFEERDLWPQTLIDFGKATKYNPVVLLLSALELFLYKKAKRIIVLFDKATEYVVNRGISASKVFYMPNGVDMSRYLENEERKSLHPEIEKRLESLNGKFIGIYTGSHGMANNLDSLLEAAEQLAGHESIHFVFVGNGTEKKRLEQLAKEKHLTNVTFLPPIVKDDIPELLKRSHVGLVSLKDAELYKWGLSFNKLYDYMAASLPVMAIGKSNVELLEQSGGGVMTASPKELASAIVDLFANEEKRRSIGERARVYVQRHHSWESMAHQLLQLIQQDINPKQSKSMKANQEVEIET